MRETLRSVGIDLGTSTTQLIFSRLTVENTASPYAVPRMEIRDREILYRSPVHFTPLVNADTLDAGAIGQLLTEEYRRAGIDPADVDTGAVIITGETARKENARAVLEAVSHLAGQFVVATAGPALESVLAARGAGADRCARDGGTSVLHLDIGGGTTNLALFDREGRLRETGCLNVGGRLVKVDQARRVTYVSPVLRGLPAPSVGETVTAASLQPLVTALAETLEEACGLRPATDRLARLITDRTVTLAEPPELLSFSGGVADLIEADVQDDFAFGDLGVLLGRAIRRSRLWTVPHRLGRETIRATVVGAGSYATELSGSTVYYRGIDFPLQDLPSVRLEQGDLENGETLSRAVAGQWALLDQTGPAALSLEGWSAPTFAQVSGLARALAAALEPRLGPETPLVVVTEQDMAKALGQALGALLPRRPLLCLDGLHVPAGGYLDVAAPVGGGAAVPVVVKTLAFS